MHEVKWRVGSNLKPFKILEARVSRHKRSNIDPFQRKVYKQEPNNYLFEAFHNLKLNKMEQMEDSVEYNSRQTPITEVQGSLKEEIVELQDQLQDQFLTRHALEKAMYYTPFSYDTMNDKSLPKETKELIKDIALLELEVVHLERYLLSLYRSTFDQQMPSHSTIDEGCKMNSITHEGVCSVVTKDILQDSVNQLSNVAWHKRTSRDQYSKQGNGTWESEKLLDSSIQQCHSSVSQHSMGTSPSMKSIAEALDSYHSLPLSMLEKAQNNYSSVTSLADHLGTDIHDLETPNFISEKMIKCISAIYCELADPPLIDHDYPCSPASLSPPTNELPTQDRSGRWSPEPGAFNSSLDNPFHIGEPKELNGPYCTMAKVQRIHRDSEKLEAVHHKLQYFRSLVTRLETANPRKLKYEEKLAFWINVHNALAMHAFLVYGIPQNNTKRMSLALKAAYTIGGHTINIDTIQSSILRCELLRPGQWLRQLFFSKTKFKIGDHTTDYSIDHREPRLHFALCAGSNSDPAVRVYTSKGVFEDLEAAKEEYILSNIVIHKEKKLHLPKIVECYAKESDLCSAGLLDMIEHLLPNSLRKNIQECQHKKSGKYLIEWIPQNFTFRYLLSKELVVS